MARPEEPPEESPERRSAPSPPADAAARASASDDLEHVIGSIKPHAEESARAAKRGIKRALPLYRLTIAVRTALAAMLAWLLGNRLLPELADYAYAAPLGAFVAIGTTLFTVARTALQQAIGMLVGAGLGMFMIAMPWNGIAEIGIIGGVAVLLQGVPRFSQGASMVPVVAVLVILFGGVNAEQYAIGYVGQFTLGMGVGVLVNALVLPALYDRQTRRRIRESVDDLAARVDVLAETMRGDWPPERDDWAAWGPELRHEVDELDEQVSDAREARRFNVRMLWHKHDLDADERAITALRAVVHRMEDVLDAVASTAWERPLGISIERDERELAAEAVAALAAHLHAWHDRGDVAAASDVFEAAIDQLYRRVIGVAEPQSGLASVVFALRAIRERIDWAASQDPEA